MSRTTIRNRDGLAGNQIRILPGAGVVLRVSGFPDVERIAAGWVMIPFRAHPLATPPGRFQRKAFSNIACCEPLTLIHGTAVIIVTLAV